ncbi:hypothetical protein U8527_20410 [Kordia algicida OT-1]|uniref:Uncharacterized protein n=1 Tax=Kordia algicida OT-1 TaxID=391587 RepID=A9DKN4_9FLAO|nr:hypothetical protein [Kordia algicida]EDP98363.1 hypothetical protein KAOT1_14137 [Kordia algicida OT-1]
MDFDKIKELMDDENQDDFQLPSSLEDLKESQMPIAKIRKTMKGEIATQLTGIVIFFAFPALVKMYELPRAVYLILMFVTSLMTLGYLAKMVWFLRRTSSVAQQTKETILRFIHDIKLTMEVYKTGIIAGSLLLPISVAAIFMGVEHRGADRFSEWFLLQMPTSTLLLVIFGYLVSCVCIYYITVKWADQLYGVHVRKLEEILKQMEE